MEPHSLSTEGLVGKVVEITFGSKRQALGFVRSCALGKLELTRRDDAHGLMNTTYMTSQFAEWMILKPKPCLENIDGLKPGQHVILLLNDGSRVCGYLASCQEDKIILASESTTLNTSRRYHEHARTSVSNVHLLIPDDSSDSL